MQTPEMLLTTIKMLNQVNPEERSLQIPEIARCFNLTPAAIQFFSELLIVSEFPLEERIAGYQDLATRYESSVSEVREIEAGWLGLRFKKIDASIF